VNRAALALLLFAAASMARADTPETVAVTYRFARGNEAALRRTIEKHWTTAKRMGLVTAGRQLYRGNGFFLEIFTWKDASIPDAAPPEIRAIWSEMERLVDHSGGNRGIAIEEIRRADPAR
jgi:hypothetical protein